jgi:hypothetical protein
MVEDNLGEAYRRTGNAFQGQLHQKLCLIERKEECTCECLLWPVLLDPQRKAKRRRTAKHFGKRGAKEGRGTK